MKYSVRLYAVFSFGEQDLLSGGFLNFFQNVWENDGGESK